MVHLSLLVGILIAQNPETEAIRVAQQAETTITLTVPAMPAKQALLLLGRAAKIDLVTAPQTGEETITFRFANVPISEAMKRIADAVDGSWKQEGSAYRLVRTADQQRAEQQRQFKEQVQQIRSSIQKRVDELKKLPPWSADSADSLAKKLEALIKTFNPNAQNSTWYQQVSALSTSAPMGRAMTNVAAAIDPTELADTSPDYRTVWSTNPTPTQRAMPRDVAPLINELMRQQSEWASAIESHHLTAPQVNGTTYWVGDFGDLKDIAVGRITTVLLTAQRWGFRSGFTLELSAFDENGKKLSQTQVTLGSGTEELNSLIKDSTQTPGEPLLIPDGDAKSIVEAIPRFQSQTPVALPPDLFQKILHPTTTDPLSVFMSAALIQAAGLKNCNMVADLTDEQFFGAVLANPKGVTVDNFLRRMKFFNADAELKDGWIVMRPSRPLEARENRADRKVLERYLLKTAEGASQTLDEQASFALSMPDPQNNPLPAALSSLISRGNNLYYNLNMLRFYATLNTQQKTAMKGDGLPVSALRSDQAELVSRMVYGRNANLQFNPTGRQAGQNLDVFYNGLLHEPTESLPSGIPPKGLIKLHEERSNVVVTPQSNNGNFVVGSRSWDANSVAFQKFAQDHLEIFPWMDNPGQKVNLTSVQFGERRQLTFTFQFTPELSLQESLEDNSGVNPRLINFNDLPEAFRKQVESQYASLKENYKNAKPGDFAGPGRNPPPPL